MRDKVKEAKQIAVRHQQHKSITHILRKGFCSYPTHVFIQIIMETMEGRRQDPRPLCMTRFKSHHSFSEATTSPEPGI
jgi:hypothetical protein